jgi:hypothetical protein
MHDEFERAVTGEPRRRGPSALGWLMAFLGFFFVVGVLGAGWAISKATHRAKEIAADFVSGFHPVELASDVVSRLRTHERLLAMSPDEGLRYLQNLDRGDPADAVLEDVVAMPFRSLGQVSSALESRGRSSASSESESSLTLHSDQGDVRFDLQRRDDGASLVIDSNDGRVRLDLARTRDGGFLTIDSEDGRARLDLARTENGGTLTIDSDQGTIRVDATGGEDRARVEISSDGGEVLRLGLGGDAVEMPGWVPRLDGMPDAPRPVYSLEADEGFLGGVTWSGDQSAEDVLAFYREHLEDEGYDLRAEHSRRDATYDEGSLWARDESSGRLVFVVTRGDASGSRVLLGYGERR